MVKITRMQSRVLHFILGNIDSNGVPPTLREIAHHFGWRAVGSAQDVIAVLRKKGLLETAEPGRARQTLPTDAAYQALGLTPRVRLTPAAPGTSRRRTSGRSQRFVLEPALQTLWDAAEVPPEVLRQDSMGMLEPSSRTVGSSMALAGARTLRESERVPAIADAALVPLLGRVQAGQPVEAIAHPDRWVTMPRHASMRSHQDALFYAVEVEGFSMVGAGMLPGDLLLIETTPHAKSGDVALAAVGPDQDVTVKRLALKGSPLYRTALGRTPYASQSRESWPPALLVPENDDFDPIPFGLESTDRIVGLVRSLFRSELR